MNAVTKHIYTVDPTSTGQTISRGKYTRCPKCHNVKYKKSWYAKDSKIAFLANGEKARITEQVCPACAMRLNGEYGAVLLIHDVPLTKRDQVESIILNEAQEIVIHNPQNRLLEVTETLDGYEVRATAAKVVNAISDKLKAVFGVKELVLRRPYMPFRHYETDVKLQISDYFS